MGWKKRRNEEGRRRKEEARVNRGQVALPDASRATTLFRPLTPHPNDPATFPSSLPSPSPVTCPSVCPSARRPSTHHAAFSSSSCLAYSPHFGALSKPLPRFHLRFLLAARIAQRWVVNHPCATFGSHARTTETTASNDISASVGCNGGFTTAVIYIRPTARWGTASLSLCICLCSSLFFSFPVSLL